ncbi:integration host factor [Pseudomaricurvus alkylphenolicus]|jgi:nucleoid DNA-binding protein|uniref:HU family DNA-binding protein n=1 Tax=Pseudomaricurvus alkylphenolicus TaxID=1306991 RepID=UPI001421BE7E|nr:HU family DNA-binding protein [Pseudomaricurvus alkylphenolicus]NIB41992.1 integration host factor [Pseudomaricurvus alkylphenolicus]
MAARKATAKKAPAKKAAAKKAPAKKAAAKKAAPEKKVKAVKERYSKTQILNQIAENTELSKKQVQSVLDELSDIIEGHIKKRAVGEFVLPGLLKVSAIKKPARKARKNVPNPFKPGETMDVAAKPATVQVKVRPLKKLKDMAL